MKKRVFSLLLVLVMVIGLIPVTAQAGELDNGLVYEINYVDGYVEITDCYGNPTEVVIPDEIEGLPVTVIGYHAFSYRTSLTSIYFEGNAPEFEFGEQSDIFYNVTATAYYPAGNPTWTSDVMQDYGGTITWVSYDPNHTHEYEDGICIHCGRTDLGDQEPVLWAVKNGITNGISADQFGPQDNCTRGAVVTFLWRAQGQPEPISTVNPFVDVKPSDFYYKAVLWAVENGITNGLDATHFGPTNPCNRAQVVTFLYRAYQ